MAYLNRLASCPVAEVEILRDDTLTIINHTLSVSVSHLIAYWVQVQPLGQLLGQALDGGGIINRTLKHQLRDPCFHAPEAVHMLCDQLAEAWKQAVTAEPVPDDDWYRIEIEKVLRLFAHASKAGECVVSVLEPCNEIHFKQTS